MVRILILEYPSQRLLVHPKPRDDEPHHHSMGDPIETSILTAQGQHQGHAPRDAIELDQDPFLLALDLLLDDEV